MEPMELKAWKAVINNINPKHKLFGKLDSKTTFATTKVKSSLCCGTKRLMLVFSDYIKAFNLKFNKINKLEINCKFK